MTELERQNGDLRRQLDREVFVSKPDHDDATTTLGRDELARRYCKW